MILNKSLIRSDLTQRKQEGNIPGTATYLRRSHSNHKRCSSSCYAQTKVQFMDLQKILYAKVEGTFKPPSLGFLEQKTPRTQTLPSQRKPQIYTHRSVGKPLLLLWKIHPTKTRNKIHKTADLYKGHILK
jgi:hypothetical protein